MRAITICDRYVTGPAERDLASDAARGRQIPFSLHKRWNYLSDGRPKCRTPPTGQRATDVPLAPPKSQRAGPSRSFRGPDAPNCDRPCGISDPCRSLRHASHSSAAHSFKEMESYQRRQGLTCSAQVRVAIDVIRSGWAMSLFQASQHASTMASYVSKTRLESWFCRRYCQTFSAGLSSGL